MTDFAKKARQPKSPVTGEKIQGELTAIMKSSDWYKDLEQPEKDTVLNGLRRIAYQQAGSTYASDAGKTQDQQRIERMDYETLAQNYIQKKVGEELKKQGNLSPTKEEVLEATETFLENNSALWFAEFLARMMTVPPHTRNQTPHPNNFYTAEAMKAENDLIDSLQSDFRTLLDEGSNTNQQEDLKTKLENWAQAYIIPPQRTLNINGEMAMSNQQSYQLYRSVPEHALAIKRVAEKVFGLDDETKLTINIHDHDTDETEKHTHSLREWIVRVGSQSIRNETWSPGDVDSKPHMRPEQMQRGILMGRVAIRQQYIHDLAKIGAKIEDTNSEGYQKIQANIWRFFNDIEELYQDHVDEKGRGKNVIKRIVETAPEETRDLLESIQKIHAESKLTRYRNRLSYKRYQSFKNDPTVMPDELKREEDDFYAASKRDKTKINVAFLKDFKNVGASFIKSDPHEKGYSGDVEKLHREMNLLSEYPEIQKINYKDIANKEDIDSSISAIDALRMQAQTYGLQSQRITHRQSSEAYATGTEGIHQAILQGLREKDSSKPQLKLTDSDSFIEGYEKKVDTMNTKLAELAKEQAKDKAEQNEERIIELHKEIEDIRIPLTKDLITFLTDESGKNTDAVIAIREYIQRRTGDEMKRIKNLQDLADDQQYTLKPQDNRDIFTFESLEMVRIGMYSGGAVARELIAETNSAEALWNVFLMQELMIDPKQEPTHRPKKVPLVEYVDDIRRVDEVVDVAYAFEPFRKAEEKLTDRKGEHRYLKVWDEERKALRDMNVDDMLGEIRASERFGDYFVVKVLQEIAEGMPAQNEELIEKLQKAAATLNPEAKSPLSTTDVEQRKQRDELYKTVVTEAKESLKEPLHALVNYAEVMTAGSDATKSGSSALYTDIADSVMDAKLKLAKYGLYTEQKSGNGSALFRANINNAIMRMRQGLEMVQGPDMLTPETERIRTYRLKRKMGVEAGISEDNRDHAALVNLNNSAGIKDLTSDEEYLEIRNRNTKRIAAYEKLYADEDFSAFVDQCTPRKLQDVFKFAARPAGRLKAKSFDVKTMRAIGYGQALGATFGQPHLIHGLAEHVLGTDGYGNLKEEKAEKLADLYLKSPDLQDEINRAVFDLALLDPEEAWKNVEIGINGADHKFSLKIEDGQVKIGREHLDINAFITHPQVATQFVQYVLKGESDKLPSQEDPEVKRITSLLCAAAVQEREMNKALRGMNALMVKVEEKITKQKVLPLSYNALQKPETLIERMKNLSPELGNELAQVRDAEIQARKEMTEIFRQVTTGEMPMPKHPETYEFKKLEEFTDKEPAKNQAEYDKQFPTDEAKKQQWETNPAAQNKAWYDKASLSFARHMDIQENALGAHLEPSHAVHIAMGGKGMAMAA